MPTRVPITDPADPCLAPFRALKSRGTHAHDGLFIAESEILVRMVLASRFRMRALLATPAKADALGELLSTLGEDVEIHVGEPSVIDSIVGFDFHRGVIALGERGPARSPGELARGARVLIILDTISNFDNLGGLFRSISALAPEGAGVILGPGCADPFYRKVLRVSMGHVLHVPFAHAGAENWPGFVRALPELGYEVVALTPGAGAEALDQVRPPERLALLVGAEGPGLCGELIDAATRRVKIPMRGGVDSLNLVVAASIALHHFHARGFYAS